MQKLNHRLQYFGLRAFLGFFRLLGLERASRFGGTMARFAGPRVGVSRRARKNIRHAMPELDDAAIERIVRDMWENLGRTMAEYAFLDVFGDPHDFSHLDIQGEENLFAARADNAGAIFCSGHFSNWELMPMCVKRFDLQGGAVYRHANNPYVDEYIVNLRERITGLEQIDKGAHGARKLLRLLKEGGNIAMLVDQKMNDGIPATFFGHRAMTTSAPAGMAVRYNALLVPVYLQRVEGTKFCMQFYPPLKADPEAETFGEIARLTQALNDFLEARIRERPHEWLWMHNRWPN
ncbi:MAG: lauroyl acyltransferase [Rhizobiales bacterium]|nr:lauroyl acyltransferase [Hyphomicrobiales bacterium]